MTNSFLLITTLIGLDVGLSLLKGRLPRLAKATEGVPLVLVEDGEPFEDRLRGARIDEGDVLEAARRLQGLERLDQIKYAVLERDGGISIVPARPGGGG